MPTFVVDPKKSLYKPIEVKIGEKTFTVRKITRTDQEEIAQLDEAVRAGDLDAQYRRLHFLLNDDDPIIDGLHIQEINAITLFVIEKIYRPLPEELSEKNESRPLDKRSTR